MDPVTLRLSPSGPVIGNPPQLTGGNSVVPGRVWVAQGSGVPVPVPGPQADIAVGLDSVVVDLKPSSTGYKYDVEFDTFTRGVVGTAGGYRMLLLGSHDGGATFPDTLGNMPADLIYTGEGRIHVTNVANSGATPINRIRCELQSVLAADLGFLYAPAESSVRVTEWSPS